MIQANLLNLRFRLLIKLKTSLNYLFSSSNIVDLLRKINNLCCSVTLMIIKIRVLNDQFSKTVTLLTRRVSFLLMKSVWIHSL